MEYSAQVIKLRQHVPISISEAIRLLKIHQRNVERVENVFIDQYLDKICQQTQCDRLTALPYLKYHRLDPAKAISTLTEIQYDRNYTPIAHLTKQQLEQVLQWIDVADEEYFEHALSDPAYLEGQKQFEQSKQDLQQALYRQWRNIQ